MVRTPFSYELQGRRWRRDPSTSKEETFTTEDTEFTEKTCFIPVCSMSSVVKCFCSWLSYRAASDAPTASFNR
jgi:hypothetical protein